MRRRRAAAGVLACAAFGCFGACAQTAKVAVPGALDAGGSPDAGPALDAEDGADVPLDAGAGDVVDGGAGGDDAEDAPTADTTADTAADTSPSHWCDDHPHAFCADFDENPLLAGWDSFATQSGAVELDDAEYTSPDHSFLATLTPVAAGGGGEARLDKRILEPVSSILVAYDVRPEAIDPAATLAVSAIQLSDAQGGLVETINVVLAAGGASIEDIGTASDGGVYVGSLPIAPVLPVGAWTRVSLDVELPWDAGLGAGTITVSLGQKVVLDHARLAPSSQPAAAVIFVGLAAGSSSGTSAVRYDDVTFDAIVR
jgi:hypothetical protein